MRRLAVAIAVSLALAAPASTAAVAGHDAFGINAANVGTNWGQASSHHAGLVRRFLNSSMTYAQLDSSFKTAAQAGMRVLPVITLAVPTGSVSGDISAATSFISYLNARYGANGSLWQTSGLPYWPARWWEIGNEENCGGNAGGAWGFQYSNPSDYAGLFAFVQAFVRNNVAGSWGSITGPLLISGTCGPIQAQNYIAPTLTDAAPAEVGFHLYNSSALSDLQYVTNGFAAFVKSHDTNGSTTHLWMDESDAFNTETTLASWGTTMSGYTRWAWCNRSSTLVQHVLPYWWGPQGTSVWFAMTDSSGVNAYGSSVLNQDNALSTTGC